MSSTTIATTPLRSVARTLLIGGTVIALLSLTACGGRSSGSEPGVSTPGRAVTSAPLDTASGVASSTTVTAAAAPVAADAASTTTIATAVTTKPTTTPTAKLTTVTATAAPVAAAALTAVDAATVNAISDIDALLSANDQDLTEAASAAARGD